MRLVIAFIVVLVLMHVPSVAAGSDPLPLAGIPEAGIELVETILKGVIHAH